MTAADLVLHGARLLTVAPFKEERPRVGPAAGDVGALMDGFVAARDGAIVATGHGMAHEAVERVEGAMDVDVQGRVVMPGFVDPHTHLCYAGERWEEFATRRSGADYLAVLAAGGGIHATVRATRDATDDQLLTLLRRRIGDAVELGTTTIEVKSGYGLEPDEELHDCGRRTRESRCNTRPRGGRDTYSGKCKNPRGTLPLQLIAALALIVNSCPVVTLTSAVNVPPFAGCPSTDTL